ncbi:serine/threonine-protein kinase [Accumulibacter sp.]|uniref:serine/threonine-protein kinase n=1 Tax=Accumulibacter sp. TaxID=2053492 RepID=UPI0025D1095C|nr:serine/threonine-protein kinase [Accumulibacter sp.]MCM8596008.1 serine/threonine-protein kinase [Accumulibacter sp.]MCM8626654.1 serine/threonine-protein kinase [Accumulibacter sp.]MDS4050157.1 serine/threonine-protein kinase [Accumulibacter sp.]
MTFAALSCPQCGGPLPRQAIWRTVVCPFCSATVTRSRSLVHAASFREAHLRMRERALARCPSSSRMLHCLGECYRLIGLVGVGEHAEVHLAERVSCLPERVIVKLAHLDARSGELAREAEVLGRLQASEAGGAAHFSRLLPQVIAVATAEVTGGARREVLLLRHLPGYWGSCAQVLSQSPRGVNARHVVWIWRRVLDVLGFVHASGWCHGDLLPEHWLVQPRDHGVLLVGWAAARKLGSGGDVARDLMQSAWTVRMLLGGSDDQPRIADSVPAPLRRLLQRCCEDAAWCASSGALGVDEALVAAAGAAFGAPRFVSFNPLAADQA